MYMYNYCNLTIQVISFLKRSQKALLDYIATQVHVFYLNFKGYNITMSRIFDSNCNYHSSDNYEDHGDAIHHKLNGISHRPKHCLSDGWYTHVDSKKDDKDSSECKPDKSMKEKATLTTTSTSPDRYQHRKVELQNKSSNSQYSTGGQNREEKI